MLLVNKWHHSVSAFIFNFKFKQEFYHKLILASIVLHTSSCDIVSSSKQLK